MRKIDLTGQTFGRLTVIRKNGRSKQNVIKWECKCDCGKTITILGGSLKSGRTTSCGCIRRIDIAGQRFGKLKVIKCIGNKGRRLWKCLCDCGETYITSSGNLRRENTRSCGCLKRKSPGVSGFNKIYYSYKKRAKRMKKEFLLSKEEFHVLSQKDCFYCGAKPSNIHKTMTKNSNFIYNGVDRMNNTKGYTLSNSVPCCMHCNVAKNTLSVNEFIDLIERIYIYIELKRGCQYA